MSDVLFSKNFLESLPPVTSAPIVRATNVWIIEWLSEGETRTGQQLHSWLEQQRTGWSHYHSCHTKSDVLKAIAHATHMAKTQGMIPILHIEAHGSNEGIAPSERIDTECITWNEFTEPFQDLNLATKCNLIVFCAACTGYAAIQTFSRGPLAPAIALIGPDRSISPKNLLEGAKEFYRRLQDTKNISEITASSTREMGEAALEFESTLHFAYESVAQSIFLCLHPSQLTTQAKSLTTRLGTPVADILEQLSSFPLSIHREAIQAAWDKMFMIDTYPENQTRFGVDIPSLIATILSLDPNIVLEKPNKN